MLGLFLGSLGVRAWTSGQEAREETPNQAVPLCCLHHLHLHHLRLHLHLPTYLSYRLLIIYVLAICLSSYLSIYIYLSYICLPI